MSAHGSPQGDAPSTKNMFLSFVPWLAFTVVISSHGVEGATRACLIAAGLAAWFAAKNRGRGGVKLIDATGVALFGAMAAVAALGGTTAQVHVVDFGRGGAALVLGVVMLASIIWTPFTEQYARESAPDAYSDSPVFRAVNRRISAVWGLALLGMGAGHLVAGMLAPTSASSSNATANFALNWAVPVLLVLGARAYTRRTAAASAPATAYAR